MRCKNCNGTIKDGVCEYCGSMTPTLHHIEEKGRYYYITLPDGTECKCYLGDIEYNHLVSDIYCSSDGKLVNPKSSIKRKITLIEY